MKGPRGCKGPIGPTGPTGASGASSSKVIVYEGTNAGFQLFVGSPGPESNVMPYVLASDGEVSGFAGTLDVNNLSAGTYELQICTNVINNAAAPLIADILATITLTVTAPITGTIVFSSWPTDVGPQPVYVSDGAPYVLAPATVTWTTNIPGMPLLRNDALSLFLDTMISNSTAYQVFINTVI